MPEDPTHEKSTLVQVLAWCRYLSQCWPISMSTHDVIKGQWVNSLAPGKFKRNFRHVIFKQILVTDGWGITCETALMWMSLDFTDDQSTLVQVMAWCRQATSHYLSQCWPRSLSPMASLGHNESTGWFSKCQSLIFAGPAPCLRDLLMFPIWLLCLVVHHRLNLCWRVRAATKQ